MERNIILILGYPRTATTRVYHELCILCKEIYGNNNCLCIYEPFNPEVVRDIIIKEKHFHDRLGEVNHDYSLLPEYLKEKILENITWKIIWDKENKKFLGNWDYIIDSLVTYATKYDKILIIKDVYLWVYMDKIKKKYSNKILIISTLRNDKWVLQSFINWLTRREKYISIRDKIVRRRITINPIKIIRYLIQRRKINMEISYKWMLGLGDFYRFFVSGKPLKGNKKYVLITYFQYTYKYYKELIKNYADIIISFDRYLDNKILRKILKDRVIKILRSQDSE